MLESIIQEVAILLLYHQVIHKYINQKTVDWFKIGYMKKEVLSLLLIRALSGSGRRTWRIAAS